MRALLYGIFTWLIIEALFSIYYGVFSNAGVDLALAFLLGFSIDNEALTTWKIDH